MRICIIVARAANGVIGRAGGLPWHLPDDLAHFKRVTSGHPLIMGRRTFDSLPGILPGRPHIVLSRSPGYAPPGVTVVDSLDGALGAAETMAATDVFVIGGESVYRAALSRAQRVYMTRVDAVVEGDVGFADLDAAKWTQVSAEHRAPDRRHPYGFSMCVYERVQSARFRDVDR